MIASCHVCSKANKRKASMLCPSHTYGQRIFVITKAFCKSKFINISKPSNKKLLFFLACNLRGKTVTKSALSFHFATSCVKMLNYQQFRIICAINSTYRTCIQCLVRAYVSCRWCVVRTRVLSNLKIFRIFQQI